MITYPHVKVNLGLSVLRKRPDGYHDLETLFVPYREIHDTLEIISGDDFSHTSASLFARYGEDSVAQAISEDGKLMITIARKEGVDWDPLKDLTARAYFLLASDHDLPPVKIFLEKTSPVGAGLGGGSSDAAFALKMLNDMFSLGLDKPALAGYASRLGSDCAFFVYDDPMFGEGRGEILTPYEGEPVPQGYELKVIVPEDVSVSTADAYKGIVPMENGQRPVSLREALARPVGEWKDVLVNDFETTVFGKHPELAAIKSSLYESGAVYAAMSGSGSALFAIYKV
ncbi:MAG: 4-(cytidine 5'-diphospho)-2-C-methyl-D-erythritol kinase [Candidatus Cryptobacteroides sp.]|nr:4-(cytidine 5'-diphospho)-2-C-methyl-D-erythritol kinase [Candidatus Cryptobacteroides sp.]